MRSALSALCAVLCLAGAAAAQPSQPFELDAHTTLLAHFDGSATPVFGSGSLRVGGTATTELKGRFKGALRTGPGLSLVIPGGANFPVEQGTVEFWVRPDWEGKDDAVQSIFHAGGVGKNYLAIAKIKSKDFGPSLSSQRGDEKRYWHRASGSVATCDLYSTRASVG